MKVGDGQRDKRLQLRPTTFREACDFIRKHHRHHKPPAGCRFVIGVELNGELVGVIVAGRPVSRVLDDGYTLEATRCCTDGTPHAASKLYAAVRRAAAAMGYKRVITYTLAEETGTSLRAAGWQPEAKSPGGSWSRPNRPRQDPNPTGPKVRWGASTKRGAT